MKRISYRGPALAGAITLATLLATGLTSPAAIAAPTPSQRQDQARRDGAAAIAAHPDAFRASEHDAFTQRGPAVLDRDGRAHVRYDRTYRGLAVLGGDAVAHLAADGSLADESLTLARPLTLGTRAAVGRSAAERTASSRLDGTVTAVSSREVVDALGSTPALAWEVTVRGVRRDQTPSALHVLVDAGTGAVRSQADEVKQGTGYSIYSGTVSIATSGSAGNYSMSDPTRGNNYTTDLRGATSGTGTTFTDADNVWGNGAQSDRASAGVDAHYGSQTTFDYYKNVLGRNGIFNNGTGVRSRVHYGNGYNNAFWDGTQMTYGDGTSNAKPLVELDVAGHEMTHGVTENTANLNYSGESGGLNEATSDIFGTAVEFYANNTSDVGDYLIGEKININGNGTPLRYMDKPSKDGASKDCWSSTIGSLDVHYSSGPANHVFYLMSEGSGAKTLNGVSYNSPTCDGSVVTAIGRDAASKIWYRALSVYMTSATNYSGARTAAINAAKDLYGASSAQCAGVEKAFTAISVTGTTCGTTPPPTGGNLLQNPGFESGATAWTQTSGVISSDSTKAHSGSWFGWLDGYGSTHTDSLSQSVSIPVATGATLSFYLRITTSETTTSTAYDTLKVQVVNGTTTTTLATYSNLNASSGYVLKSFNLGSYVGKTVTVKLVGTEDSSLATSFYVDDFSLTTS
ncbi:MAG TPA: M4 family metallopeptidase [Actinomycetes bacterium]